MLRPAGKVIYVIAEGKAEQRVIEAGSKQAGMVEVIKGVEAGATVAVFGAGGVGLAAIQGARIAGAAPIVAVDVVESKLQLAKELGATDTVLADLPVGTTPYALAYNHLDNRVYVANNYSDNVSVIDGAADNVVATVAVGHGPVVSTDSDGIVVRLVS